MLEPFHRPLGLDETLTKSSNRPKIPGIWTKGKKRCSWADRSPLLRKPLEGLLSFVSVPKPGILRTFGILPFSSKATTP